MTIESFVSSSLVSPAYPSILRRNLASSNHPHLKFEVQSVVRARACLFIRVLMHGYCTYFNVLAWQCITP